MIVDIHVYINTTKNTCPITVYLRSAHLRVRVDDSRDARVVDVPPEAGEQAIIVYIIYNAIPLLY